LVCPVIGVMISSGYLTACFPDFCSFTSFHSLDLSSWQMVIIAGLAWGTVAKVW